MTVYYGMSTTWVTKGRWAFSCTIFYMRCLHSLGHIGQGVLQGSSLAAPIYIFNSDVSLSAYRKQFTGASLLSHHQITSYRPRGPICWWHDTILKLSWDSRLYLQFYFRFLEYSTLHPCTAQLPYGTISSGPLVGNLTLLNAINIPSLHLST